MDRPLARARGAGAALAMALAVLAGPAWGGPPFPVGTVPWTGAAGMNPLPGDAGAMGLVPRPSPFPPIDTTGRLQRVRLDAEAHIRALRRDLARDAQAPALRRSGDPIAIEQARTQWRTEERLDALQSRIDWDAVLTPGPWNQPGPVTRRILEQSRIRMRTQQRERDVDARADALLPALSAAPTLGSQPPTSLEPLPR